MIAKDLTGDNGDINRTITWQYDNANKLIDFIRILKKTFDSSTRDFFLSLIEKLNPETADDFGLSLLGKTLGIPRNGINTELYRRLIIGRTTLLNKEPNFYNYKNYIEDVFQGFITVSDNLRMGLGISISESTPDDMKTLIERYPDIAFVFPCGVRSSIYSNEEIFGFGEQVLLEEGVQKIRTSIRIFIRGLTNTINIPTGTKVIIDDIEFHSNNDIDISLEKNGDSFLAYAIGEYNIYPYSPISSITDSVGTEIADTNLFFIPYASVPDFYIGNFASSSFSWYRPIR